MDIIKELYNYGLVPVIKITDVNNAVPLAKALAAGGLNCAEITFRTACAKEAIAKITKEMPALPRKVLHSPGAPARPFQGSA